MRSYIHAGFISAMLLSSGIAQATDQIRESEIWALPLPGTQSNANDPISKAQKTEIPSGSVRVSALLGLGAGTEAIANDTDFYRFYGMEGDVVTIDIDGGVGGGRGTRDVDTTIAVFRDVAGFPILRLNDDVLAKNDDAKTLDEGSNSTLDARLDNVKLPASGYYIVGVTNAPRYFANGGAVKGTWRANGDYTLIITGVTPDVQQINIEIKPGNDEFAPINPKAKGKIPVALLSSTEFNAMNVDTTSLTFGETGNENSSSHCGRNGEDVNGDGRLDLVCHFDNQQAGFAVGDLEGILRGKMKWGSRIEGRGILKVVPEKRGS